MSAWKYLKAGFWQRVPLPLLGRVPLNAAALAAFSAAGFDQPVFWAVGAAWETAWLTLTAGRVRFRRTVDDAARRQLWRALEERRLQLYNLLSIPARQIHHHLLTVSQSRPRLPADPPPVGLELFAWFHLKLLLTRQNLSTPAPPSPSPSADPDIPRLHALAAVEITDPALTGFANDILALLDPRQGLRDATFPPLTQIDAALARINGILSGAPPPLPGPALSTGPLGETPSSPPSGGIAELE